MKNFKNEKGAITIVVLITVLFMVSFLLSTYIVIASKVKTEKEMLAEVREIYEPKQSMADIYNSYFASSEVIPIYTVEQYLAIGSGNNVLVNGKYYTFSNTNTYVLMNNFEIDEDNLPELWDGKAPEKIVKKAGRTYRL